MVSHFDRHSHYTTDRGSVKLPSPGRRHHHNPQKTRRPQPREGWGGSFTGAMSYALACTVFRRRVQCILYIVAQQACWFRQRPPTG